MTGLLHDPDYFSRHNKLDHAENAGRLELLPQLASLQQVPWRLATDEELLAVHTPGHLHRVSDMCAQGGGMLDADTYCGPESDAVARAAAGGLVDLSLAVRNRIHTNGLALVRPPGHHATADCAMGFCLYNTVAVAAAALRGRGVSRVAIIDFDVHHGNGTQDIFCADESVLYLSSHQYPHYPGSGAATETGRAEGVGYTVNHPLAAGAGDVEMIAAYTQHLLPALADFQPEFVLVSAGYDAHAADPLAGLNVTTAGFTQLVGLLVHEAVKLCEGKIVLTLEGGYNAEALAECVAGTVDVLTANS